MQSAAGMMTSLAGGLRPLGSKSPRVARNDESEGVAMLRAAMFTAALLLAAGPARAGWLDHAWDNEAAGRTGAPAITLTPSGIFVVLPEATLAEAHAAGVETQRAVQLFLRRYGQHCSEILDLDRPHRGLKVSLSTSKPVPLEDASERVQREVLDALKSSKAGKRLPRVENLFVVSGEAQELVIDYVPERQASCVRPGDPIS
jgi:hypothetical protein